MLRVSRSRASKRHAPSASPLKMAAFVLGAVLVFASGALYLRLNWESIVSDGAFATSSLAPGSSGRLSAPAPGASELRYYNGARLFAKGRYREALSELGLVARDSAVSEQARSLVLRIEERLLRGAPDPQMSPEPATLGESKPN